MASAERVLENVPTGEANLKIAHFREQMTSLENYRRWGQNSGLGVSAYQQTMTQIFEAAQDSEVRNLFSQKDLSQYAAMLNNLLYKNRTDRLAGNRNRDSDLFLQGPELHHEALLKSALLQLVENISQGEFRDELLPLALTHLLNAMNQSKMHIQMLQFWEDGVNDEVAGKHYLNPRVLSTVLPVAYDNKRFSYEEILHLYDVNTKGKTYPLLLQVIGRIALEAGDHSRGFECMEALLRLYEDASHPADRKTLLRCLSMLHLLFIGKCRDLEVARQFFDKVVLHDLPYTVILKCNQVTDLLQTCLELELPFEDILYFWSETVKFYQHEDQLRASLNLRYLMLHSKFFAIFFEQNPTLTADAYNKLRETIALYAQIKPMDEFFLNALISNYSWGDKVVLGQLMANYEIYHVKRTPVSYRVGMKKMGEIADFTDADILSRWNESLRFLDGEGFHYIPMADWAALRDATIKSPHAASRTNLYLAIANTYKDYIQDPTSVNRFVRFWFRQPVHNPVLDHMTEVEPPLAPVEVPVFQKLTKNVDFVTEAKIVLVKEHERKSESDATVMANGEEGVQVGLEK